MAGNQINSESGGRGQDIAWDTIITAGSLSQGLGVVATWRYRELCYLLAARSIAVRYKQTLLGVGWAVLQPLAQMIVFSVIFGGLASLPSDGFPYPLFVFSALLPWQLFSRLVTETGACLVTNKQLVTKVYFPRLCIPVSIALAGLVDFFIASSVLVLLMFYYEVFPGVQILLLPFFLLLLLLVALGVGMIFSVLHVKYRDVAIALPFLTQLWLFATPVIYPSSVVPPEWGALYALNPLVAVIDGTRFALLGTPAPDLVPFLISIATGVLIFVVGLVVFKRGQRHIVDILGG